MQIENPSDAKLAPLRNFFKSKMAAKKMKKKWKIRNICQTIHFFDMLKEQKLFIMKKHIFLSNFIKIGQKLTKLSNFKILQKCEKFCFFHVFSLYFEKYQIYIYFVRTKKVPCDLFLLHAKL